VPVPPVVRGDNPKAKLAETRDALGQANSRLIAGRDWYDELRQSYRGSK
jgi:hypothetical protein